jgi:hypoxanthine-guanine phosphoribosyltransferase
LNLEEVDILYTPEQIREKVKDLGSKISVDYKGESLGQTMGRTNGIFIAKTKSVQHLSSFFHYLQVRITAHYYPDIRHG